MALRISRINFDNWVRETLHYRGRMVTEVSQTGELVDQESERARREGERDRMRKGENESIQVIDTEMAPENEDPARRRFVIPKRAHGLVRLVRKLLAKPELTEDEKAQREEERKAKELEKVYMADLRTAERIIIGALTRRGIIYRKEKDGKVVKEKRVRISNAYMSVDGSTAYFHIEPGDMPFGHGPEELITQACVDDISWSLGKRTRVSFGDQVHGTVYIVERAATAGIPDTVDYMEMVKRMPESLPPLTLMLGKSIGGKPQYRNLEVFPHLLIGGETGSGKSVMMNGVICTLIYRNTPDALRLWMIDLKGGVELGPYEGIPHLIPIPDCPTGIARTSGEALKILDAAIMEGSKRLGRFSSENDRRASKGKDPIRNIGQWNKAHRKERLEYVVIFVDELALLARASRDVYDKIDTISATLRSAGIHMVIATQLPDRETIGKATIKTNFPARFAFAVPDHSQSILMVNTDDALNLAPKGRFIFKYGMDKFQVQAPYCSSGVVKEIIDMAKKNITKGEIVGTANIEPQEIIEWALNKNNSLLDHRTVYNEYRSRGVTDAQIRKLLKEMDDESFVIGENEYRVVPGDRQHARRVAKIE